MTIIHTHTITYKHEDGWSIELPEAPLDFFHQLPADGVVVDDDEVRYIIQDDTMGYADFNEFYGELDGLTFKDFSLERTATADDFNDLIETLTNEGYEVFPVGKYEHGLVSYSLHHKAAYPDMQWDYGIAGVIGVKDKEFLDSPENVATTYLKAYTDWCNGSIYAVVTVPRDPDRQWDYWACGGFLESGAVEGALRGAY